MSEELCPIEEYWKLFVELSTEESTRTLSAQLMKQCAERINRIIGATSSRYGFDPQTVSKTLIQLAGGTIDQNAIAQSMARWRNREIPDSLITAVLHDIDVQVRDELTTLLTSMRGQAMSLRDTKNDDGAKGDKCAL